MAGHEAQAWGYELVEEEPTSSRIYRGIIGGDASSISNISNNSNRSHGARNRISVGQIIYSMINTFYLEHYALMVPLDLVKIKDGVISRQQLLHGEFPRKTS